MIALATPYLWYTTRATGIVALILFTLVVSLGTLVANRIGGTIVGRFEINELHRSLSIVAMIFLVLHILTTVLDNYVSTGLISAFIPMTSAYKRVAITFGAVAFDLIVAVWISSLLKLRVANSTWRFIHWFSWIGFATALVHAYMSALTRVPVWGSSSWAPAGVSWCSPLSGDSLDDPRGRRVGPRSPRSLA